MQTKGFHLPLVQLLLLSGAAPLASPLLRAPLLLPDGLDIGDSTLAAVQIAGRLLQQQQQQQQWCLQHVVTGCSQVVRVAMTPRQQQCRQKVTCSSSSSSVVVSMW
jgi:hypothetical protein